MTASPTDAASALQVGRPARRRNPTACSTRLRKAAGGSAAGLSRAMARFKAWMRSRSAASRGSAAMRRSKASALAGSSSPSQ